MNQPLSLPASKAGQPIRASVKAMLDELGMFFKFDPPLNDKAHLVWEQALQGLSDAEVRRAGMIAVRNHKYKNAPLPASIIEWTKAERETNQHFGSKVDGSKWVFWKPLPTEETCKNSLMAYHPDISGSVPPTEIELRAQPKMRAAGREKTLAQVRRYLGNANQQQAKEAK